MRIGSPQSRILFFLLIACLLVGCDNQQSRLDDALQAFENREIDKAVKELKSLVADDYAPAKYVLAFVLQNGLSDSASDITGESGYVLKTDYPLVKKLLVELVEQGGTSIANDLADTLVCESAPDQRDYDEIIHLRRIAGEDVRKGWAVPYANELTAGLFIPQDLERAEEIYEYYAGFEHHDSAARLIELLANKETSHGNAAKLYYWASLLKRWKTSEFDEQEAMLLTGLSEAQKEEADGLLRDRKPAMESDYRQAFGEPAWGWTPPPLGSASKTFEFLRFESARQNPLAQIVLTQMHLSCLYRGEVNYGDPELQMLLETSLESGHPAANYLVGLAVWVGGFDWSEDPLSLWLEAANAGLMSAQSLIAAGYRADSNLIIKTPFSADPVEAYFWSVTHNKNYLNKIDKPLQQALTQLSSADVERLDAELKAWEAPRFHDYPLLFETWPAVTDITASAISVLAVVVLIYLSFLTWRAGAKNIKNLAVASVLLLEAMFVLLMITPHGLPSNWMIYQFADTSIRALGPIVVLLVGSYLILAGQFRTPLTKHLGSVRSVKIIACASVLGAVLLPLWVVRYFHYGFYQLSEGMVMHFVLPNAVILASLVLIVHLYMLVNLIYLVRTANQQSDESRQVKAFLLAYILRFALLATSILTFLGGIAYFRLVEYSGLPEALQSVILISYAFGELIFGILFSLGILREQIFGIERLFKRSLVRIALFGFVTLGFLATEQLVGNLISDAYGTAGGIFMAMAMLALHRPFTEVVNKQLDRWLPDSDVMDDDVAKVYAHQYKLAMRDGDMSLGDRDMLNLTAKSLGLNKAQVALIEEQISTTQ